MVSLQLENSRYVTHCWQKKYPPPWGMDLIYLASSAFRLPAPILLPLRGAINFSKIKQLKSQLSVLEKLCAWIKAENPSSDCRTWQFWSLESDSQLRCNGEQSLPGCLITASIRKQYLAATNCLYCPTVTCYFYWAPGRIWSFPVLGFWVPLAKFIYPHMSSHFTFQSSTSTIPLSWSSLSVVLCTRVLSPTVTVPLPLCFSWVCIGDLAGVCQCLMPSWWTSNFGQIHHIHLGFHHHGIMMAPSAHHIYALQ